MSSLKSDHHFLCEFLIFFSRVNLTLRYKFSQFIHRFKMWILKWWPWAVDSTYTIFLNSLGCTSKFLPIHQRFWKLGFLKSPCLHIWSSDNEDGLSVWHMVQEGRTPFMSMLCFAWIFPNMQCYFPNHLSKFRYFLTSVRRPWSSSFLWLSATQIPISDPKREHEFFNFWSMKQKHI